jgi:large subunit ribosomal protein L3
MAMELVGRKLGMTQIFNEEGDRIPVTVVEAGPCTVLQKKTAETDGYSAAQLGFEEVKPKHASKARQGHCSKAGQTPKRVLFEVRLTPEELAGLEVGQAITAGVFEAGQRVDVTGRTKGRGFAGVVKRHGVIGARASHGTHEDFRHIGSMGAGTYPGRVIRGKRMAGHLGDERVTTLGLRVEKVDAEKNLIFVRGAVPGHTNALVRIRRTVRAGK